MIGRRRALAILAAGACTLSGALAARAAPARKVPVIYMLLWRGETDVERGFRSYFAANNIDVTYVVRDCNQDVGRIPAFIQEIKKMRPDLVYTWGTPMTLAVVGRRAEFDPTRNLIHIPVVFTMVSSPTGSGLVDENGLSHRNYTGTSHLVPVPNQLRAIAAYRHFQRLAVIYNPTESNSVANVRQLKAEADRRGFSLISEPVPLDSTGRPMPSAIPSLIEKVAAREPQFLYLGPDSFIGANAAAVTEGALQKRLPTFSATEAPLRGADALFGLVSRYEAVGRLTAYKAEQILSGKPPGQIPAETLTRFSYVIRMPVARELDFYPPLSLMSFAEVLQ